MPKNLGMGARLILEFFVFFFGIFFVFWVSHVFSFFFWYFPFILLDFPVNSDVFFTFVLFFLAVPCVSFFFGFLFLRAVLGRGVAVRGVILKNKKAGGGLGEGAAPPPQMHWVLLHLFVLHFLFCSSVFFLILMSYVFCFFVCSWKRGVAVRGVILKNKKAGGGLGGRAQRLHPKCIGCCCICSCCMSCFVLPFFS